MNMMLRFNDEKRNLEDFDEFKWITLLEYLVKVSTLPGSNIAKILTNL